MFLIGGYLIDCKNRQDYDLIICLYKFIFFCVG